MPVSRVELIGRTIDNSNTTTVVTRRYHIHGPAEEDEVAQSIGELPLKINGLPYLESHAREIDEIAGDWDVTVVWGSQLDPNTSEYRFNFTAPSAHISQSLETYSYTTPEGTDTNHNAVNAPFHDGAINVVSDGGKKRVEGIDLGPPPEVFTLTWAAENTIITDGYQRIVEDVVGTVNAFDYRGRPAGSLLLSRVSGGRTGRDVWAIEFGFSYIANSVSIPVGSGMTVASPGGGLPAKRGHDLLWIYYGEAEDNDYGDIMKQPVAAYVERVWPYSNFDVLQLPE